MILSFSVPAMRPMIEAGLREMRGELQPGTRVKRQTIRARGPRADKLLRESRTVGYNLHLWWKSRTPERALIGVVRAGSATVWPIEILHTTVEDPGAAPRQILRLDGPRGWRTGDAMIFWSPLRGGPAFEDEARADGFDTVEAFRDWFVPKPGDRFAGILYRW